MKAENITLEQYNVILFRRIIEALHEEYGLLMTTSKRRGHYRATAVNNTRTITYKVAGLKPKILDSIRKNANMSRYTRLGERRPIRFEEPGNGILLMEIPKLGKHWEQVTIKSLEDRRYIRTGTLKTALGLGHQDRPITIDFSKPHNSTLGVFGITQSGKTNTVKLLVWSALMSGQADVILIDLGQKEKNFGPFEGAQALAHPLIVEPQDGYDLLIWLKTEIARRASSGDCAPLFVVIDEVQTFIDYTSIHGNSSALLSDITRQCIQVGIKLIVSTQQAEIGLMGKSLNNLRLRACHKVDKAASSTFALGIKGAGAEGLLGYGDCLFKNDDGLHRMSVARLDEKRDAAQYARIERGPQRFISALGKTLVESAAPDIPTQEESHPTHVPDEIDFGQVASAIFAPAGIGKLSKRLRVGKKKAKRVKEIATEIRAYAYRFGHEALPPPDYEITEAIEDGIYNWLSDDWEEV